MNYDVEWTGLDMLIGTGLVLVLGRILWRLGDRWLAWLVMVLAILAIAARAAVRFAY